MSNQPMPKNITKVKIIEFLNKIRKMTFEDFQKRVRKDFIQTFKLRCDFSEVNMSLVRKIFLEDLPIDMIDSKGQTCASANITSLADIDFVCKNDLTIDKDRMTSFLSQYPDLNDPRIKCIKEKINDGSN
jgi:hypothetical protein